MEWCGKTKWIDERLPCGVAAAAAQKIRTVAVAFLSLSPCDQTVFQVWQYPYSREKEF